MMGATAIALQVLLLAAPAEFHNPWLMKAIGQLQEFQEPQALLTLEKAKAWPDNTVNDLAEIEMYIGLARAELSGQKDATSSFRIARKLAPTLRLPPGVAPRVVEWWEAAASAAPVVPAPPLEPPAVSLIPAPAPAPPPVWVEVIPRPVRALRGAALAALLAASAALAVGIGLSVNANARFGASRDAPSAGLAVENYQRGKNSTVASGVAFGSTGLLAGISVLLWNLEPAAF